VEAGRTPGFAPGNRVRKVQSWLVRRADTSPGRLALDWFRRYFEASKNSGCAITVYASLSVLPAALVIASLVHSKADTNAYAERLVTHLKLTGASATLVESTFGSASSNQLAASVTVAVSFLFWGIGIGQLYQDVYARCWRLKVGSVADQGLFAIFFFVLAGSIALFVLAAESLRAHRLLLLVPAWLAASMVFWLWVPWFLLHRKVALRALMPGALLATVVLGGAIAFSPLFVAAPLNANGRAFGSFGVVLTLIGYVFIMITMSLVCAVFSPVWGDWRRTERAVLVDGAG
jgi:membrane protein